jgi:AcrR family transcriptional regulator
MTAPRTARPASTDRPSRKPRARLSREQVLDAAIRVADEGGIEAVTMRRVAREVGSEVMSLYYHAASKDDLLAGMTDRILEEMPPLELTDDWRRGVRDYAVAEREVLRQHDWAPDLLMSSRMSGPRVTRMDGLLGGLRRAGFEGELGDHAYHAIDIYVLGYALWESRLWRSITGDLEAAARAVLDEIPRESFPHAVDHIEYHLRPSEGPTVSAFEFGLDLILDGLERARQDRA